MTWTRTCRMLCVATLALIACLPSAASARSAGHSLRLGLPAPGHISVETVTVTVTGKQRGLPKRLKLLPQKLAALPPSVRVIWARRTIKRKRSTTYALALVAVNVATKSAQAASPKEPAEGHLFGGGKNADPLGFAEFLLFMGSPVAVTAYLEDQEREEERERTARLQALYAGLPERLDNAQAKKLAEAVKDAIDANGDGKVDPSLETGHYDDGHAFGWAIKDRADEKKTWGELATQSLDQYVNELEDSFQYDIDGDGTIESAPRGGQQIDTQVGTPVVTGGG